MKNIILISTLTVLTTAAMAQDYCSNLNREQARLADCQRNLDSLAAQLAGAQDNIRLTERDINNQTRRDRQLQRCRADKKEKENLTLALNEANAKADKRIVKVRGFNQDIANRIGNRLIVKHECTSIYPRTGNMTVFDRDDWGRFVGKKAIFFAEGRTVEQAKNNMLADARRQGFFDENSRRRTKRLLASTKCFPIYNKDHAQRILGDVQSISNEAAKIKMPQVKVNGQVVDSGNEPRERRRRN